MNIAGMNPVDDRTQAIGKRVGFLPQRAASLLFHETVEADVAAALESRGADRSGLDDLLTGSRSGICAIVIRSI